MIDRYVGRDYYEQGQSVNLRDWLHALESKLNECVDALNQVQATFAEMRAPMPRATVEDTDEDPV